MVELKRMLNALGYWRPGRYAEFPTPPPGANSAKMQALRKSNPAAYEKALAETKQATTAYNREFATFDDETVAAVDKFRADKSLNYQGNPPGLVDQRFVDALKAAYLEQRKSR